MVLEGLARSLDSDLALTVLVPDRGEDYDLATVRRALEGNLAGLILASPGTRLLESSCHVADCDPRRRRVGRCGPEHRPRRALGRATLSEYLASLGHRSVAYVGVSRDKASLQHRRDELRAGLERGGQRARCRPRGRGSWRSSTPSAGSPSLAGWSAGGVTAVVCGDDLYAYGVMRACRALGVAIPRDLSLVGFNDLPYSELAAPPLTSVNLFATKLGAEAARLLQRYMRTGKPPRSRQLETSLVIRESTAARTSERSPRGSGVTPR